MNRTAGVLLLALLNGPALTGPAAVRAESSRPAERLSCPPATGSRPLATADKAATPPLQTAAPSLQTFQSAPPDPALSTELAGSPQDYRRQLRPTALGWARLEAWCVAMTPAPSGPQGSRERACLQASRAALEEWSRLLPIRLVEDPRTAQVILECRRPPLIQGGDGRSRASRGRALLQLREVLRGERWQLEPWVRVLIDPGQRAQATTATALHELGHAFGLWGHSDHPDDAMAVQAGPRPVLQLSARDRATLRWLYAQPSRFGKPLRSTDENATDWTNTDGSGTGGSGGDGAGSRF